MPSFHSERLRLSPGMTNSAFRTVLFVIVFVLISEDDVGVCGTAALVSPFHMRRKAENKKERKDETQTNLNSTRVNITTAMLDIAHDHHDRLHAPPHPSCALRLEALRNVDKELMCAVGDYNACRLLIVRYDPVVR
jgi:hypothetical protein